MDCETGGGRVVLVLSEHGSCQGVRRRGVDQLQNLPVAVLRVNVDGQNGPEDLLQDPNKGLEGVSSGSVGLIVVSPADPVFTSFMMAS